MKCLDKVYDAYVGLIGDQFALETRERIDWICGRVQGNSILDIGCSQGIVPILLAKENDNRIIIGLDIEQESIDFASEMLSKESVADRLSFICSDFLAYNFADQKFDTILITEVLEHLIDVEAFLKKANNLIKENGTLVVTVPFGINDFPDHKRTYYLQELNEQVSAFFAVQKVHYMGKWVGLVAVKGGEPNPMALSLTHNPVLHEMEENIYKIERQQIDRIVSQHESIKVLRAAASVNEKKITQMTLDLTQALGIAKIAEQEIAALEKKRLEAEQKRLETEQKYKYIIDSKAYKISLGLKEIKKHPLKVFCYMGKAIKYIFRKR